MQQETDPVPPQNADLPPLKRPWWFRGLWGTGLLFSIVYSLCFGWIGVQFEKTARQIQYHTFPKQMLYWHDYVATIVEEGRLFPLVLGLCHWIAIAGLIIMWKRKIKGLVLYSVGITAHTVSFLCWKGLGGTSPGEIMLGGLFMVLFFCNRRYIRL